MQHTKFETKEQDLYAAVFRMHELETRVTMLSDENRSLTQKMGKQGTGEAALAKKLAEKSKEFDDLTAKLGSMQSSSQGVMENRIREEVNKIQQEHFKLHVQAEHAQAEIARLGGMIEEREVVIKSQKRTIDDLEELMVRIRDEYAPDSGYSLRTERDLMMDALQRSMLSEFESQKKAQAESFVAELSVKMRHFNGDWERRFESASEAWAEAKSPTNVQA